MNYIPLAKCYWKWNKTIEDNLIIKIAKWKFFASKTAERCDKWSDELNIADKANKILLKTSYDVRPSTRRFRKTKIVVIILLIISMFHWFPFSNWKKNIRPRKVKQEVQVPGLVMEEKRTWNTRHWNVLLKYISILVRNSDRNTVG